MANETQAQQALSREESITELRKTIHWAMKLSETIKTVADMFAEGKSLEEVRAYSKAHFGKIVPIGDLFRVMSALATLFGNEELALKFLNDGDDANWSMNGFLLSQLLMGVDVPLPPLRTAEESAAAGQRTLDMLDRFGKLPMDWATHADGVEVTSAATAARINGIGLDISAPICNCEEPCHHFDLRTSLGSTLGPTIEVGCCKCGTFISRPLADAEFFFTGGIIEDRGQGAGSSGKGVSRGHLRIVKPAGDEDAAGSDGGGEGEGNDAG